MPPILRTTLIPLFALCIAACSGAAPTPTPTPVAQAEAAVGVGGTPVAGVPPAAAGQQPQPTAPPTATPTATPIPREVAGRLVLWHSWSQADGDALTQILEAARQAYPNLLVDTLFVALDDVPAAYATAVQAGGGPDLLLAPDWWLGELAQSGVLAALNDRVSAQELADYWPSTLVSLYQEGSLYGLPTSFELVSLFYNRSLLGANPLPATSEALLELAGVDPRLGVGLYLNLYHLYWGIPAYGGALLDQSNLAVLERTPGTASFLAWLRQASQTPGIFVSADYGMLLDRFKKGEYTFFVDGPWSVTTLREALGADLGVAPLPAGPAGPAQPWLSVDAVFINPRGSEEQQALALALARLLSSATSGTIMATTANRLPAQRAASVGDDPVRQGFVAQVASAQPLPSGPEMQAVWGYGGDMLIKVVEGDQDPAQVVVETATLINEANSR